MATTSIEWTNETWNPLVGCAKISAACANCYAIGMTHRLASMKATAAKYEGITEKTKGGRLNFTGKVRLHEPSLEIPKKWKNRKLIFVNSMGDLFHENVPFEWVDKVMEVIAECPQHVFQILTKRPERMCMYFAGREGEVLPNVWLGITAENQATYDERVPFLMAIQNVSVRFLSCEPLLSYIDLDLQPTSGIGWVIAGGEAGAGKGIRPMHPDWVRSLRNQCQVAGVPFFFKQHGRWLSVSQATEEQKQEGRLRTIAGEAYYDMVGKDAGNTLDGQIYEQFPELPTLACSRCGASDNAAGYKDKKGKFVPCVGHEVDAAELDGDTPYQARISFDGTNIVCQKCTPRRKQARRKQPRDQATFIIPS